MEETGRPVSNYWEPSSLPPLTLRPWTLPRYTLFSSRSAVPQEGRVHACSLAHLLSAHGMFRRTRGLAPRPGGLWSVCSVADIG